MIEKLSEQVTSNELGEKNYLNIHPVSEMTVQEANDFIANEFNKSYREIDETTYIQLLSEVYNRFEDEIAIDFKTTDRIKSVVDIIKSEAWETLSETEKGKIIEELVKSIAQELKLERIPTVEICDLPEGEYGSFRPLENKIVLNTRHINESVELINTVAHEIRHAYQHMRAEILETKEDALFHINFENYIDVVPLPDGSCLFFYDYYSQYVEVDARAFANSFWEANR